MQEEAEVKPAPKEEIDSVIVSPPPELPADSYEARAAARRARREKRQERCVSMALGICTLLYCMECMVENCTVWISVDGKDTRELYCMECGWLRR